MARPIAELGLRTVRTGAGPRSPTRFFLAMAAATLSIVLVGFARTLYLRMLFDVPPIPAYLYVHGVLLTAWFALVAAQTLLIRARSVSAHRRLGTVGVFLGVAVVAASAVVTLRFVDRVMHQPTALDTNLSVTLNLGANPPLLGVAAIALWGNMTSLVMFTVLLGWAVLERSRSDTHKRLMVLASLSLLPPAIARISRWPGLGGDVGPFVPIVMLLLLAGMVGFDLYTRRRVHRATVAGGGFVVLGIVASSVIARTSLGLWIVRRLG